MKDDLLTTKEFVARHPVIAWTTLKRYCKDNPKFRKCRVIKKGKYLLKEGSTLDYLVCSGYIERIPEKKARRILAKLNKINYIEIKNKPKTKGKVYIMAHKKKAHSKKMHHEKHHEEHEMHHKGKHHEGHKGKAPMHKAKHARGK